VLGNEDLLKLVTLTTKIMFELTTALKKTNFKADEKQLAEIEKIIADVSKIEEKVNAMTDNGRSFNDAADFEPINEADKKKLVTEITTILNDNKLETAMYKLEEAYVGVASATENVLEGLSGGSLTGTAFNAAVSFGQSLKKDVQLAKQALVTVDKIGMKLSDICNSSLEVCHASVTYIASSTGSDAYK
jgi:hypothetical protein